MSFTSIILAGCFFSLVLGLVSLFFESGYRVDLRKRASHPISGGRRSSDPAASHA